MRVLACLLPHVHADGGKVVDGYNDPDTHALHEAIQIQTQLDGIRVQNRKRLPVRLHHDYWARNDDSVGHLEQCWLAQDPLAQAQFSLWGWLDVNDDDTCQRIQRGDLPECSSELLRTRRGTGMTGVMLCAPSEAYFEHSRIYPPTVWEPLLISGISESSSPSFRTVPFALSPTMADFSAQYKDHPAFPGVAELARIHASQKDNPVAQLETLRRLRTLQEHIIKSTQANKPAETPAAPTEPMQTGADKGAAAVPATLQSGHTLDEVAEGLASMRTALEGLQHLYSARTAGKRTAAQREPDAPAASAKASHAQVPVTESASKAALDAVESIWD